MACLRTQGRLPKLPWLKNKKWGAVVCPQLWDNAPAHWNVEPWRGPYTLDDRLPAEGQLLWGCEARIALDLPCSTTSPPAYYHLPIPAVRPAHLRLPTSTRSPPWTPQELSDALPLWSPPEQPFHRIPQRSATATSDLFIHHLLKIQTQTCSYDYIYCLYHWWGGRKCTVLSYFLRTSRWLPPFPCILHQPSYAGQ